MMAPNYPSEHPAHRRADVIVHQIGLLLIVIGGGVLLMRAPSPLWPLFVYVACALASNLSSQAYHFAPCHDRRPLLRRIDHAAIYLSIVGTFTPLLIAAGTARALWVLALCWICAAIGISLKLFASQVKARWSTTSYLALGLVSFIAIADVYTLSPISVWCIVSGSACYVLGTVFYARKTLPYRYSIWHGCATFGALFMFAGIWLAVT